MRQRGNRGNSGRGRVSGKLEHIADGAALHTRIWPPRTLRVLVAATPAIVGGIGVYDHARGTVFLGHKAFHSAKILAVAHQYDFSAYVNFQLLQLAKVFRRTV